jgi:hypothetical protein
MRESSGVLAKRSQRIRAELDHDRIAAEGSNTFAHERPVSLLHEYTERCSARLELGSELAQATIVDPGVPDTEGATTSEANERGRHYRSKREPQQEAGNAPRHGALTRGDLPRLFELDPAVRGVHDDGSIPEGQRVRLAKLGDQPERLRRFLPRRISKNRKACGCAHTNVTQLGLPSLIDVRRSSQTSCGIGKVPAACCRWWSLWERSSPPEKAVL